MLASIIGPSNLRSAYVRVYIQTHIICVFTIMIGLDDRTIRGPLMCVCANMCNLCVYIHCGPR